MKQLFILLFIVISSIFNSSGATQDTFTYYPSELHLHKDIQLLTYHMEIRLVSIRELNYQITYTFRLEDKLIDPPVISPPFPHPLTNKYSNGEMAITVDEDLIKLQKLEKETVSEKQWEQLDEIYGISHFHYINHIYYIPVSLEKGEHTITVHFKSETETSVSMWYEYLNSYEFKPLQNKPIQSGIMEIDVIKEDTFAIWKVDGEELPVTGTIKKVWNADNRPCYLSFSAILPKPSWVMFIEKNEDIIFLIWNLLLLIIHIVNIYRFRVKKPDVNFSKVAIRGGIFLPFIYWTFFFLKFSILYPLATGEGSYSDLMTTENIVGWLLISSVFVLITLPLSLLLDFIFKKIPGKRKQKSDFIKDHSIV